MESGAFVSGEKTNICLLLILLLWPNLSYACDVETAFSPKQGGQELIIKTIQEAKFIHMAAYQLTSKPIINALSEAHKAGKEVKIILDKSQLRNISLYEPLTGVPIIVSANYKIFHNKFIVTDEAVETGSFNYSKAAEFFNAENVVIIHNCKNVTESFEAQFQKLYKEAE